MEASLSARPDDTPELEFEAADVSAADDPDTVLVRSMDWRVAAGDGWLVAGPPECGKTSLLLAAAGQLRPVGGRHRLFGSDLTSLSEREQLERRLRVGIVFGRGGRLFARETVVENLTLPLQYQGRTDSHSAATRVKEVLAALELEALADRCAGELPRRMAQRVALARALVLGPDVLMFDDPLSGQPPEEEEWWMTFVARCRRDGAGLVDPPRTLVVAASDPRPWRRILDRFGAIVDGRWCEESRGGGHSSGLRPAAGA